MAYFRRTGATTFEPTDLVGGAWRTDEQHVAPTLGLLAHLIETDRDARGRHDLAPVRLSYDIWGTYPLTTMDVEVEVIRPGRGVELVEARMSCGGRQAVTLRAWLAAAGDSTALAAGAPDPVPGPDETPAWDPTIVWPGAFVASIDVHRTAPEPGRGVVWVRTPHALVEDEPVSDVARLTGLLDVANGMSVRADPREVAFPNLDLTAHLHRAPSGEWLGLDTTVTFGAAGAGLTSSIAHDAQGPFGTAGQALVVRDL